MKAFLVISVGRQIGGDFVLIRTEKAFSSSKKAEDFCLQKKQEFVTKDGKPKSFLLSTGNTNVECMCEAGMFEIEIEE